MNLGKTQIQSKSIKMQTSDCTASQLGIVTSTKDCYEFLDHNTTPREPIEIAGNNE